MTPPGGGQSLRRAVLGGALVLLGLACGHVAWRQATMAGWRFDAIHRADPHEGWWLVALAAAITLLVVGALLFSTGLFPGAGTPAVFRLDWYLPFLRKKKAKETLPAPSWLARLASRVLPATWRADRITGKPGAIRRWLKWLGPSLLSSPLRRVVQATCLLVFLVLFFYVCWPYRARPAAEGQQFAGWKFSELDHESGAFRFSHPSDAGPRLEPGQPVFVVDDASAGSASDSIAFTVARQEPGHVALVPLNDLSAAQFDALLLHGGGWTICEQMPNRWPSHYADDLASKQWLPAELFLVIDPLVSLSTAIAARSWVWSLASAGAILIVCVLIPRGFCGYLCPLGTVIDLFDWTIGKRVTRFRVADDGWWVHLKYYLLAGTLVAALGGVLVSGFVAAIPVITRAALFLGEPLQTATLRGGHLVPALNSGQFLSIAMFAVVLGLGLLKPRFWCKYVCPSGAVFSLGNLFRVSERKVESTCINCNKCVEICPFDAIKPDFTTRVTDCTLCQTCGGVCPTHAIKFVERWNVVELKTANDPPTGETSLGRRGFLSLAAGAAAAVAGGGAIAVATKASGGRLAEADTNLPVRPPGSVPEPDFLQLCIRCGECFKACPNNVLQPEGFQQGLEGLWTPLVNADWAGCASSCNACGQVCPTGAIRALPLEEKRVVRMGLAIVDQQTCLPLADREACQLCVDECVAAGYDAIEFTRVHTRVDADGQPLAGSGFLAPVVLPEKCVGCGLCQTRCHAINAKEKHLLDESAIVIVAGDGREDRLRTGSYIALREIEAAERAKTQRANSPEGAYFVPEAGAPPETDPAPADVSDAENPFGLP